MEGVSMQNAARKSVPKLIRSERNFIGKYPRFEGRGVPPCATADPAIYFPERTNGFSSTPEFRMAKKICSTCPYRKPCLEWAVENNELGLWAGTTERERRAIRRERQLRK
jgi:WhiB family redox-sensing transcriptional regulator